MSGSETKCLATVVSDPFVTGAVVMLSSFLKTNPWFDGDIVILHHPHYSPISEENRAVLKSVWRNVLFEEVDAADYDRVFWFAENVVHTPARLRAAFLILDAFRLQHYRRIVTLDSDMLILGDLRLLFELEDEFCVVRAQDHADGLPRPFFNTGTMSIGGQLLHGRDAFDRLIAELDGAEFDRRFGKADQAVLNLFFRNRAKTYLDERFNYSKRLFPEGQADARAYLVAQDIRVLHFVGEKPWNAKIRDTAPHLMQLERLWFRALLECAPPDLAARALTELNEQYLMLRDTTIQNRALPKRTLNNRLEAQLSRRNYPQLNLEEEVAAVEAKEEA